MDGQEAVIRDALQRIFAGVTEFLKAHTGASFEGARVEFVNHAPLDTSVRVESDGVVVSIDAGLYDTIVLFNRLAPRVGLDAKYRVRPNLDAVQGVFDDAMSAVYRVAGSAVPEWIEVAVPESPEYQRYVQEFLSGLNEVQPPLPAAAEEIRRALYVLAEHEQLAAGLSETQLTWIYLHECAHILLGHSNPCGTENLKRLEFEADRLATDLFLKYYASVFPRTLITTAALPCLLVLFAFFEFIRKLLTSAIQFAKLSFLKDPAEPWPETHPDAIERARAIIAQLDGNFDEMNRLWASLFESGLHWIEQAIVEGLVDLRYFKRYCRAVAQQQMVALHARQTGSGFADFALKIDLAEWDSIDLKRGPLKEDVFRGTLMPPLFEENL